MQRILGLCLAIVLCGGCASYTRRVVPNPKPEAMAAWKVQGSLAVGADPYVDADRQMAVFDGSLTEVGVLPIQVLIENHGDQPIVVHPLKLTLTLPDGAQVTPVEARTVVSKFEPHYGRGFDTAAVAFGLVGAIVAMSAVSASEKAQADRHVDYATKELKKVTIESGGSTHGFVFFMLPTRTMAFSDAILTVPGFATDESPSAVINLPLTKLNSKERK